LDLKKNKGLKFNILGIYRIQESEILKNGSYELLDGSSGLTLNMSIIYSRLLKKARELNLLLAFPVIDRNYRADGLTRNIVIGLIIKNL
jgi:hypothetical protein